MSATDETWSFLFDFDGTIIDSFADLEHCTNDTLRELGLSTLSLPTIRGMIGYGLEHLLRSALHEAGGGGVSTEDAVAVFRPIYAGCGWTRTTMFDGMRAVLEDLSTHRRALVSNKPDAACETLLDHFSLRALFDAITGGDTYPEKKPHAMPIEATLKVIGGVRSRAVMIGDDLPDVHAAQAAGIPSVGVGWGRLGAAALREAGATEVVEDVAGLRAALHALTGARL